MNPDREFGNLRMQRDNLLLAVSGGAAKLVKARRWRLAMDEVLGDVATAAHVDRAWLFRVFRRSDGELRSSLWHEWGAAGTGFVSLRGNPVFRNMPIHGPRHDHSLSFGPLLEGRMYLCPDVRELPPLSRATAESLGIRSIIRAPVLRGGRLWGAIGFDSVRVVRQWLDAERQALTALSTILSAVLDRDAAVNVLWSGDHAPVPVALQAASAAAIAELHRAESLNDGIARALEILAMVLHAERVWITENRYRSDGGTDSSVSVEWAQPQLRPLRDSAAARLDVSGTLRRWYDAINAGQVLRVTRADSTAAECAALDAAGVDQFIGVPVPGLTHRWHGTLSVSRRADQPFNQEEVRMLEAVADAMHAARDRRQPAP